MIERTCALPSCDHAVDSRGFCNPHWSRWSYLGKPAITPTVLADMDAHESIRQATRCAEPGCKKRGLSELYGYCCGHRGLLRLWSICLICSESFKTPGARGVQRTVCDRCSSRPPLRSACVICHGPMVATDRRQRVCSTLCSSRLYSGARDTERTCKECGAAFVSAIPHKVYCSSECQHIASDREYEAKRQRRPHTEAQTAYAKWRDARKRGMDAEVFTTTEIADRDGWRCGLCRKVIGKKYAWPHPRSLSLDHIVPLSMGGSHTKANTQAAHLRCNISKGVRARGEQLALI